MDNIKENIENSDLILRFLSEDTNEKESRQVQDWINSSEENSRYFNEIKDIFNNNLKTEDREEFNPDVAWNKFVFKKKKTITIDFNKRVINRFLRIAATFVLILGTAASLYFFSYKNIKVSSGNYVSNYNLPDGSIITLNANSSINYKNNFGKKYRELNLNGEAFFDVVKNKNIPFIIHVENIDVEVVGTSFNINSFNKKVEVVVKTGVVKVKTKDNKSWILNAGSRVLFDNKENLIEKNQNTNLNYLAWKTKVYIFEKTKMSEVFQILEKDYTTDIDVVDKEFYNCELYSVFENKSLDDILSIIKHTFGIEYTIKKGKIIIKGKGC